MKIARLATCIFAAYAFGCGRAELDDDLPTNSDTDALGGDSAADGDASGDGDVTDDGDVAPPTSPHAQGSLSERPEWTRIDTILDESQTTSATSGPAGGPLTAYTFEVYRLRSGVAPELVYSRSSPGQTRETTMKIASASKTITAAAALRAVAASADLQLATTTATLARNLGVCADLPAYAADITLSHLLHQTSGISEVDHACVGELWDVEAPPTPSAMRRCACRILEESVAPEEIGKAFRYGANNFTVAAAVVEEALGQDWYAWFADMRSELGLSPRAIDYALYSDGTRSGRNSNVAGGVLSSAMAYMPFLIDLPPSYFEPFGDEVVIGSSPFTLFGLPVRYGLGNWSTCVVPWPELTEWPRAYDFLTLDYAACPKRINHSLGKFGFMPWISSGRGQETFIAVLATDLSESSSDGRVSRISYDVHLMLEPVLARIFSTN